MLTCLLCVVAGQFNAVGMIQLDEDLEDLVYGSQNLPRLGVIRILNRICSHNSTPPYR